MDKKSRSSCKDRRTQVCTKHVYRTRERSNRSFLSQEACPHSATPHRPHPFCARIFGTEEQGDSRFERTEEQVEDLFSITSPTFFSRGPPSRFLLDPWNADLCCSITYFLFLSPPGSKARGINCSTLYERLVSSTPPSRNASRPNFLQFVGQ